MDDAVVLARRGPALSNQDLGFAQRIARFDIGGSTRVRIDVTGEPIGQIALAVTGFAESADLVACDHLQVMGKTRYAQHVLQHGRDAGIGRGGRPVIHFRFLNGGVAIKRRELGILAMAQRYKTEFTERLFEHVGDDHVGGRFLDQVVLVRGEGMHGQARDKSPTLKTAPDSTDIRQPTGLGKSPDQNGAEGIGRVAPQIPCPFGLCQVFLETEAVDACIVVVVRQTPQDARRHQADEARILFLAKGPPRQVFVLTEDPFEVDGPFKSGEVLQPEHRRMGRRNKRRKRSRGDLRNRTQGRDIIDRMPAVQPWTNLVIADQNAERHTSGRSEFLAVDLAEQLALVELDGMLGVPRQLFPGDIQRSNSDIAPLLDLIDQIAQSMPRRLDLLKPRMMDDGVELIRQQCIQQSDVAAEASGKFRLAPGNVCSYPQSD